MSARHHLVVDEALNRRLGLRAVRRVQSGKHPLVQAALQVLRWRHRVVVDRDLDGLDAAVR
jgi:hypothetical protein